MRVPAKLPNCVIAATWVLLLASAVGAATPGYALAPQSHQKAAGVVPAPAPAPDAEKNPVPQTRSVSHETFEFHAAPDADVAERSPQALQPKTETELSPLHAVAMGSTVAAASVTGQKSQTPQAPAPRPQWDLYAAGTQSSYAQPWDLYAQDLQGAALTSFSAPVRAHLETDHAATAASSLNPPKLPSQ